MFSILKRSKKLVLNCYTYDKNIYQTGRPVYSSKFLPDWWKNLPKFVYDESPESAEINADFYPHSTMKHCAGLIRYYSRGLIVPLWCDLMVEVGERGYTNFRWQYSDGNSLATQHDLRQQMGGYIDEREYSHLKLIAPWAMEMDEDIQWVWTDPCWNTLKQYDYKILPGVMEYKHLSALNINLLFNREERTKRVLIEHGTPMVNIIPITERKIELKCHLISREKWEEKNKFPTEKFYRSHFYRRKIIDQIEAEQSKCPFSKLMKR